jgi:hypothetical protein
MATGKNFNGVASVKKGSGWHNTHNTSTSSVSSSTPTVTSNYTIPAVHVHVAFENLGSLSSVIESAIHKEILNGYEVTNNFGNMSSTNRSEAP